MAACLMYRETKSIGGGGLLRRLHPHFRACRPDQRRAGVVGNPLQRYQARLQGQNAALAEERDRLEKEVTARAVLEEELRYLATTDR